MCTSYVTFITEIVRTGFANFLGVVHALSDFLIFTLLSITTSTPHRPFDGDFLTLHVRSSKAGTHRQLGTCVYSFDLVHGGNKV